MTIRFYERTRPVNPTANFSVEVAESVRNYVLYDDTEETTEPGQTADLRSARDAKIIELLGGTDERVSELIPDRAPGGPGSISRRLPLCDPDYYSLFCDNVAISVDPDEFYGDGGSLTPYYLQATPVEGFANYSAYAFNVKFSAKPYAIVHNDRMEIQDLVFYDEADARFRLYYYQEWLRYCTYSASALDTRVRATIRSGMRFRAPGLSHAGLPVDGAPCDSIPDFAVPDSLLTITWMGVPQRYITSPTSFLKKYRGRINQTEFTNGVDSTWPAGSLLYQGYTVAKTYTQQPTFVPVPFDEATSNFYEGTFAASRLVDLQLMFIDTTREPGVEPAVGSTPNRNWIAAGHNLLPHFPTKKFLYVTSQGGINVADDAAGQASWVPSYLSIPFEILFQDPDIAAGQNVIPF